LHLLLQLRLYETGSITITITFALSLNPSYCNLDTYFKYENNMHQHQINTLA